MNILIVALTSGPYNSIRPEAEIYISLAKAGFTLTIFTDKDSSYKNRFEEFGIKVIPTFVQKKFSLKNFFTIRKIIKEKNIDIVYTTTSKTISNTTIACIGTDVKLVTYRGTTGGLYRTDPSSYFNGLSPRVDGIICVSKAVENHVAKQVLFSSTKVQAIYKGHQLEWYDQDKADLTLYNTNKNNFNIAFVANVRPHKGLIYLLQAAKELTELKDIHIILIGAHISKEPYISAIDNSGMKERIHMTGYINNAPQIIAACDVLVHASTRKEGLPRVILEALACKTPVIASSNESSLEIIEDGVNGFITPIKDAKAIADKIILLHSNPEILKKVTENAQDILKDKMSHDETVKNYMEYFESLVKTK